MCAENGTIKKATKPEITRGLAFLGGRGGKLMPPGGKKKKKKRSGREALLARAGSDGLKWRRGERCEGRRLRALRSL